MVLLDFNISITHNIGGATTSLFVMYLKSLDDQFVLVVFNDLLLFFLISHWLWNFFFG